MEIRCAYKALLTTDMLYAHPSNPNEHDQAQIELFAEILKYQGWRRPITVSNRSGFITKGHGALAAAKHAGCEKVPVDYQDYDDEAQELADIIADNQLARLSQMNTGKLSRIMTNLDQLSIDTKMTGFSSLEIERFLQLPSFNNSNEKYIDNSLFVSVSVSNEENHNHQHSKPVAQESIGAKEISDNEFQNFAHQCPRCKFEFD